MFLQSTTTLPAVIPVKWAVGRGLESHNVYAKIFRHSHFKIKACFYVILQEFFFFFTNGICIHRNILSLSQSPFLHPNFSLLIPDLLQRTGRALEWIHVMRWCLHEGKDMILSLQQNADVGINTCPCASHWVEGIRTEAFFSIFYFSVQSHETIFYPSGN